MVCMVIKNAMDRFCKNFERLSESVQGRLTVENDDKESMYSVKDLMYIHERIGIPIVFDYHHHKFNTGGLTEQEALELAISTWQKISNQLFIIQNQKHYTKVMRNLNHRAHSDYINDLPDLYGNDVDVMVESNEELSILPFINSNKCEYSGLLSTSSYE